MLISIQRGQILSPAKAAACLEPDGATSKAKRGEALAIIWISRFKNLRADTNCPFIGSRDILGLFIVALFTIWLQLFGP